MKKYSMFVLCFLFITSDAFAWFSKEVSVHQTAGFQTITNAHFTRVLFNAVDVNVGGAWNPITHQWCPGITGTADISASVLWVDTESGGALPDNGVTEIFVMRHAGVTAAASDYSGVALIVDPLWANIASFAGSGNQSNSIHRQSLYVDNANYCYSISVFQWNGMSLRITDVWPQVTWASFRMNQ